MGLHMEDKGKIFRRLHELDDVFVIPNPWDIGTARILETMGFKALATTSAGLAFSLGVQEGTVPWEQTLAHCQSLVNATSLPVSADLEKGMGDCPESAAQTVDIAASIGLAGCSLEDHTGIANKPIYDFSLAVERIEAAAQARDMLAHDFVITARAENFMWGITDLDETILRLQAFEKAGADVLYAPGLRDITMIKTVCQALTKPVNVVMGLPGEIFSMAELADAGVKRISVGASMARFAYGMFVHAAQEITSKGTFSYSKEAIGFSELASYFEKK